jgi:hypothetical protein
MPVLYFAQLTNPGLIFISIENGIVNKDLRCDFEDRFVLCIAQIGNKRCGSQNHEERYGQHNRVKVITH